MGNDGDVSERLNHGEQSCKKKRGGLYPLMGNCLLHLKNVSISAIYDDFAK
jgi:hypothetical protein